MVSSWPELGVVDVGDGISDGPCIFFSRTYLLLDLHAISSASREPVYDVPLVVAAELLIRLRDMHREIRTNDTLYGFLDVLLQGVGREAYRS